MDFTNTLRWQIDEEQYKKRNVVECFFQRLKENHRIAMRFDKRADRFMAFVFFASILLNGINLSDPIIKGHRRDITTISKEESLTS